ncbi:MAG: SNF2-related protein [Gammaproteobacteria bacterium]
MSITDYHAKYLAYELTKRCASDSIEKFAPVLADAQVDLNPHQVEAALFAFRSPFSRGAILADEVGLGKTIEAGLLLSQKWAERKRHLLVIVPANLRKQWSQELADKFHLPSVIMENRSFNEAIRSGNFNPFQQDSIILCSYQFARTTEPYLRQTSWDLVVIDEAHRLRNVYKNSSKIALAIKQAESNFRPWDAEAPKDAEGLARQLELHIDHIHEGRTANDLLYEILLKTGFPLTMRVETLTLAGKIVHSVAGGALFICLERKLTLELIRAMAERKPERVVCLDQGFAGNDQLKANAVQIFKTKGVTSFKTV